MMVWTPFKYGTFLVSLSTFWGAALFLQEKKHGEFQQYPNNYDLGLPKK